MPLVLRNMDRVARRIKVLPSDSPYFKLVPQGNGSGGKIAPGMEVVYEVIFTPDQYKDYVDEIVCLTEREKFVIPIRAVGARAMLDFPDAVTFSTCPVKHTSTKVLLVRNIGGRDASFSVQTEPPFSITPKSSQLGVNGTMQIEVGFNPQELGSHSCNALLTYDTGEQVEIDLYGAAEDANVRLDKATVALENTFIGQSSQRTLKIQNRSDIVAHFEWKAAATSLEEDQERQRVIDDLDSAEENELDDFDMLMEAYPTLRDQMALLTRKYKTKRQGVTEQGFTLEDDTFILDPPSGDIWPNSEIEVTVAFRPTDATPYSRTVYCDITGRETRLPLKLRGEGVGPQLRFSFDSLDMGKVFVGSSHTYEVILSNVGDIDGVFKLTPPNTVLGSCFYISPTQGVVPRGGHQAVRISFRSVHLGHADEDIALNVDGAPEGEAAKINIVGDVIGPTFRFDVAEVNFDRVAYGFVATRTLSLINTSLVPMTYTLHFPDDCEVKGDFEIEPAHGTIPPDERQEIKLDLVATSVCQYDTYISVDVAGVGNNLLTVPVFAESIVPDVTIANPLLDFGRCFLDLPQTQNLQLVNTSDLPASYTVLPFDETDTADFHCVTQGFIPADGMVEVPIALTAQMTGDILVNGRVEIAGLPATPLNFKCGALGEGPVLSVSPVRCDWGRLQVLDGDSKEIHLSNESAIEASFQVVLKKGEVFVCEPASGTVAPGATISLWVTATLDDMIQFSDRLTIDVKNGCNLHLPLHASGTGTTIWCEQALDDVDFGKQFSKDECVKTYTLVNKGRRSQKLQFKLNSPLPGVSGECTVMRGSHFEKKRTPACPNPPEPHRSHFGVWPERLELAPGESTEVQVRGICDNSRDIAETFLCMGSLESQAKQRVLFKTNITASFINPLLEMSTRQIKFTANQSLDNGLRTQSQQVQLTNTLELPVSVSLSFSNPAFVLDSDSSLTLEAGGSSAVQIAYNPLDKSDSFSRKDVGNLIITYAEHPQVDKVKLLAEVYYPNLGFSVDAVEFGCVPNGQRTVQRVELTNHSLMPVEYEWKYDERVHRGTEIEQVFDIVPMKAKVLPGESVTTKFFFHGHPNCMHKTVAQCAVKYGPTYSFAVHGAAAEQVFHVTHPEGLAFGKVLYNKSATKTFEIVNTGMVDVPYSVLHCPDHISLEPAVGVVPAKGSETIAVEFSPGTAEKHDLSILMQIAHEEPSAMLVSGTGVYPTIAVQAPDADESSAQSVELKGGSSTLDMGAVVRGNAVNKEITLTNTFAHPVTIKVLRKKLQSEYLKAFTIEPDEIVGLPAGASTSVRVKFISVGTKRTEFPLGLYGRNLPLQVIGGPRINVALKANVCEPTVEMSSKNLNFDSVKVGECRVMEIQLFNPTEVTASWNAHRRLKPLPSGMSKDAKAAELHKREMADRFIVWPESGTLEAGETANVTVRFTPVDDMACHTTVPIKVSQCSKPQSIKCRGEGMECLLEFIGGDTMGPILPYSKGDEKQIIVKNNSSFPIEFYSEEYDAKHREEEDILASLTEYDENNQLFLPPRPAGEPLPHELTRTAGGADAKDDMATEEIEEMSDEVFHKAEDDVTDDATIPEPPAPVVEETEVGEIQISPVQAAVDRYLGEDVKREKFAYDHGGFNAIVHGPAYAGKHTQAYALAAKYEATPLSVDDIVEQAMHLHTPLGDQARTFLVEKEEQRRIALEEPAEEPDHKKKNATKKDEPVVEEADKAPEIKYTSPAGLPEPSPLDNDLLFELIKDRVDRQDALDGVVFCGLQCKYGAFLDVLGLLLRALNKREHLYFYWLEADQALCRERIMKMHNEKIGKIDYEAEVKKIKAVTEFEYEAMSEDERVEFDAKQKHLKQQLRVLHHDQLLRDEIARQEEQRRMEEENKNSKKGAKSRQSKVSTAKTSLAPSSMLNQPGGRTATLSGGDTSALQTPEITSTNKTLLSLIPDPDAANQGAEQPIEMLLLTLYEQSTEHVTRYLQCFDRSTGLPAPGYLPPPVEEEIHDGKGKDKKAKVKSTPNATHGKHGAEVEEEPVLSDVPGVALTIFTVDGNGAHGEVSGAMLSQEGMVAPYAVLQALGKTDDRPGIADPLNYWVVDYPEMRELSHESPVFSFFDPEIRSRAVEKAKKLAADEAALALEEAEHSKSTKGNKKSSRPESRSTKKDNSRKKSASGKRGGSGKKQTPSKSEDTLDITKIDDTLKGARWTVPANSELVLNLRFRADFPGVFDQTFNFESVVSQRKYSVFVRGMCEYPHVSATPSSRTLAYSDKSTLDLPFRAVLVGLPREEYKSHAGEGNVQQVMLKNPSDVEVFVSAGIQNDTNFNCFTCDPQSFSIPPGGEMPLRVWAYPKECQPYLDNLVVCVRDNPVPIVYPLSAQGVKPELEFHTTAIQFDRVLVRRKDTRSITITNKCPLPVKWACSGLEQLTEDFDVPVTSGMIEGEGTYELIVHFRATRPCNPKKNFKIEYYDANDIVGLIGSVPIQVQAEAYDLVLSLVFPKGCEESKLDFEQLRVGDEKALVCTLKNRGKYDVKYMFSIDKSVLKKIPGATEDIISVFPSSGELKQADNRALNVKFVLKPHTEVVLDNCPLLRCEIIDPNIDETIARIPVVVSAKAVHSTYTITPSRGINFGPHEYPWNASGVSSRLRVAPREFVIENTGTFEFRYNINKAPKITKSAKMALGGNILGGQASNAFGLKAGQVLRRQSNNLTPSGREPTSYKDSKFSIQCFTVSKSGGVVAPGAKEKISVEVSEPNGLGKEEAMIYIDVEHREEADHPAGFGYKLAIEACRPTIISDDFHSIFCEHPVVTQVLEAAPMEPTFVCDTKQLLFGNVPLDKVISARVRVHNPTRIEVEAAVKYTAKKTRSRSKNGPPDSGFIVEPAHLVIPAHEYGIVVITFNPVACQPYLGELDITLDPKVHDTKSLPDTGSRLHFEVAGDGALPRVTLVEPNERTAVGAHLMQFRRTFIAQQRRHGVVVRNDGPLPARVILEIVPMQEGRTPSRSGAKRPQSGRRKGSSKSRKGSSSEEATMTSPSPNQVGTPSDGVFTVVGDGLPVEVPVGESVTIDVSFSPKLAQVYNTNLRLTTFDNHYDNQYVEVAGEGFVADSSIEGLTSPELLNFGDTQLSEPKEKTFHILNHSADTLRFAFDGHKDFHFNPALGFLPPKMTKTITATFQPTQPCDYRTGDDQVEVQCAMKRVKPASNDDDLDWDGSRKVLKWVVSEGAGGRLARTQISELVPEPSFTEVAAALPQVLKCAGVSDYCKFEVRSLENEPLSEVAFKETLMFQTRDYSFKLHNSGSVAMTYSWNMSEDALDAGDDGYMPFVVEPAFGTVAPGGSIKQTVKFAPLDAGEFAALASCTIDNLHPDIDSPQLDLWGSSKRPFCHFELPPCDYVTGGRRDKTLKGPTGIAGQLDPSTRVFELVSVGVGKVQRASFFMTNPVDVDYEFKWKCQNIDAGMPMTKGIVIETGPFRILTAHGVLKAGKKIEIIVEFVPLTLQVTESFWKLCIPEHNIDVPFMIVGRALEPRVSSNKNVIQMMPLLVGQTLKQTFVLRNDEDTPFRFNWRQSVIDNLHVAAAIKIEPIKGSIPANGTLPINVYFTPKLVQPYNFQMFCDIKKKPSPLLVNIRCASYSVKALLFDDASVPLEPAVPTSLDFGSIAVYDNVRRPYLLQNNGDHPFNFDWTVQRKKLGHSSTTNVLTVEPATGSLESGGRMVCNICFAQKVAIPVALKDIMVACKVTNGPSFRVAVSAVARLPQLTWSFSDLKFGKVLVYQPGMQPASKVLIVTNQDTEQVSLSCVLPSAFTDVFQMDFKDTTIQPNEELQIPIKFTPTEARAFNMSVDFTINSRTTQSISVSGTGVSLRLAVKHAPQRILRFGSIAVGSRATKTVEVVNQSVVPVEFAAMGDLQGLSENNLTITPTSLIKLQPQESQKITFTFEPTRRIAEFTEKITAELVDQRVPLLDVVGACQGVQFEMDNDQISFGTETLHSRATRRVLLNNTGDIGAKFAWQLSEEARKWFTIVPETGYLSPGLEVILTITFMPHVVQSEVRFEGIECAVENGQSLYLDLSGNSVPQKPQSDTVVFNTSVRNPETKTVKIENKTSHDWNLLPKMAHPFFSGVNRLAVPAGSVQMYQITYLPLVMNQFPRERGGHGSSKDDAHTSTLFFALPDGGTLMYNLQGYSSAPKSVGTILRDLPCKVPYTESLPVHNWLSKPQRFKLHIKPLKTTSSDNATRLEGLDYIDVPGSATRDYKLNFFAYREGTTQAEVVLRNEETGEYVSYDITFKATPAGILDNIKLNACVRSVARASVKIHNPIMSPVTIQMACAYTNSSNGSSSGSCTEIHGPSMMRLPAAPRAGQAATGVYTFDFLPLLEGKRTARLTLTSAELGIFQYDLALNATPHGHLPVEKFTAHLGEAVTHKYKFTNYNSTRGEYQVKVDHPAFTVPSSVSTVPAVKPADVEFEVSFEPSQLGSVKAMMVITSKVGGVYNCPLFGQCAPSRPSGPFVVRTGHSAKCNFKNVFSDQVDYKYSLDNPAFSLDKDTATLGAKKSTDIMFRYQETEGGSDSAKLIVAAASGDHSGTQWVFYLKGTQ